jgi:hypothetical protein
MVLARNGYGICIDLARPGMGRERRVPTNHCLFFGPRNKSCNGKSRYLCVMCDYLWWVTSDYLWRVMYVYFLVGQVCLLCGGWVNLCGNRLNESVNEQQQKADGRQQTAHTEY